MPEPIDLAFVVGAIRAHAPELCEDLDEAIAVWLRQARRFALVGAESSPLPTRHSRLHALREQLNLGSYEPDPRD